MLRWGVVAFITMIAIVWAYNILTTERHPAHTLPVYGEKNDDSTEHKIADWKFVDKTDNFISERFDDKIYVADFSLLLMRNLFKMSTQMERVARQFKGTEFSFSHTVKPRRSVSV